MVPNRYIRIALLIVTSWIVCFIFGYSVANLRISPITEHMSFTQVYAANVSGTELVFVKSHNVENHQTWTQKSSIADASDEELDFLKEREVQNVVNATASATKNSKKVLLYTYMRGGSTLLGDIFLHNNRATYWYEPLDGFYQTYFVIQPSANPMLLLYFSDQTKRTITKAESHAVAEFHHNLFNCHYRDLPMSLFADGHNKHSTITATQVRENCELTPRHIVKCQAILYDICKSNRRTDRIRKVNMGNSVRNNCFERVLKALKEFKSGNFTHNVWGTKSRTSSYLRARQYRNSHLKLDDRNVAQDFHQYVECLQDLVKMFAANCEDNFVEQCRRTPIQVAKVIRLSMEHTQDTMDMNPDLYLVYYVRDPRGVIASRLSVGLKSFDTIEDESRVFCERVSLDLKILKSLRSKYGERILEMKYEDLAKDPVRVSQGVYEFIGEIMPIEVKQWITSATHGDGKNLNAKFGTNRENSADLIDSWRGRLRPQYIDIITENCQEVLNELGYEE